MYTLITNRYLNGVVVVATCNLQTQEYGESGFVRVIGLLHVHCRIILLGVLQG